MRHSIVTWDCSYRAFHHLIDSMAGQDYPADEFELIYVEQRTKRYSNDHNRKQGLASLWDRYQEAKDGLNIKVVYVGDPATAPYHPGRCINAGLAEARGLVVSVMDGDQLLRPDFLSSLTIFHGYRQGKEGIASVHCHVASGPVGATEENWTGATFDFDDVLALCPYGRDPYPAGKKPGSYGAMVSTIRVAWEDVNGMDEHPVWATSASMVISDAAHRLEMLLSAETELLQDTYSLHPWHPHGYGRAGRAKKDKKVLSYLGLQRELMASTEHPDWRRRTPVADKLYEANKKLVDAVHRAELRMMK